MTTTIATAAILGHHPNGTTTTHTLPRPHRHPDIYLDMQKQGIKIGEQGFITSDGEFVDRRTALKIARRAGQLIAKTDLDQLYTEDLW